MYYVMLSGSVSGHQVQWQVAFTDSVVEGLQEDYMQDQADAHENGEYFEYTRFEEYLVHSARSAVLRGVRRTYGSDMQHHTSIKYDEWRIEREEQIENDPDIVKQLSEKVIQY